MVQSAREARQGREGPGRSGSLTRNFRTRTGVLTGLRMDVALPVPDPSSIGRELTLRLNEALGIAACPEPVEESRCPAPWIVAMLGWLSNASTRASRSNRASRSGSLVKIVGRTLIATSRPASHRARDTPRLCRPLRAATRSCRRRSVVLRPTRGRLDASPAPQAPTPATRGTQPQCPRVPAAPRPRVAIPHHQRTLLRETRRAPRDRAPAPPGRFVRCRVLVQASR